MTPLRGLANKAALLGDGEKDYDLRGSARNEVAWIFNWQERLWRLAFKEPKLDCEFRLRRRSSFFTDKC